MPSAPCRRRGFTLVELLVVLAIIAVLLGLLVPATTVVLAMARGMKCQSSLRQIGLAALAYAGDWEDVGPPTTDHGDAPWKRPLMSYLDAVAFTRGVFRGCPSHRQDPAKSWETGFAKNPCLLHDGGGGTNDRVHDNLGRVPPYLGVPARPPRLEAVPLASTRAWFADSGDWILHPYGPGVQDRHRKRVNVLFVDGHVAAVRKADATRAVLTPPP